MSISKKNTAVISVVGCDRVGIIAGVSTLLSENGINIKDIAIENSDIVEKLNKLSDDLGVSITIQHTDLFNAMHRI